MGLSVPGEYLRRLLQNCERDSWSDVIRYFDEFEKELIQNFGGVFPNDRRFYFKPIQYRSQWLDRLAKNSPQGSPEIVDRALDHNVFTWREKLNSDFDFRDRMNDELRQMCESESAIHAETLKFDNLADALAQASFKKKGYYWNRQNSWLTIEVDARDVKENFARLQLPALFLSSTANPELRFETSIGYRFVGIWLYATVQSGRDAKKLAAYAFVCALEYLLSYPSSELES